ncbi:MAG: B12-binding domain-containing radical SAM protein [Deltaproteobacteria bacterium]|nr:B12-binding domain-containing radical SAM protein [Deltaproteobacteria bacterium]
MKILCVSPVFPETYWGQERALRLIGKRALLPPLGLLTVAALLPRDWEVRLCDMNVEPLHDSALAWADAIFLSGMLVQRASMLEVAARARAMGKTVVAGGPHATATPEAVAPYVDCIVVGEAEEVIGPLCEALAADRTALPPRFAAAGRPHLERLPPPRYDLLDVDAYHAIGVQWGRGCPFNCEFCDIVELFGRRPRTKEPEQFCRELDAVLATGFRGSLFVVDDNFVGNRKQTLALLAPLAAWMRKHDFPFQIFTEASINLAGCEDLIAGMVAAGFDCVFVGIETPSPAALREAHKLQNLAVDLDQAVEKLIRSGLEVMAGFIVGFDADDAAALERQRDWVLRSPIPQAMIGVLTALPGTQLERRLAREGRLLGRSSGDTFGRPNFRTKLPEATLLAAYRAALAQIYQPREYFARCQRALDLRPSPDARFRLPWTRALRCLLGSLWRQGVTGGYRGAYWRFLGRVLLRTPKRIARALSMAIAGEHMIRYTRECVLPRLASAIAEVQQADPPRKIKRAHAHGVRHFVPEPDAVDGRMAAV